jgi:hypothetical protein
MTAYQQRSPSVKCAIVDGWMIFPTGDIHLAAAHLTTVLLHFTAFLRAIVLVGQPVIRMFGVILDGDVVQQIS